MKSIQTIARGVLVTVMAVAYIVMSFSSVTHELTHWAEGSAALASASTGVNATGSAVQASDEHHATVSASSSCFFCLYSSSILQVLAVVLLIGLPMLRRVYAASIPEKPIVSPSFSAISLRGPPV